MKLDLHLFERLPVPARVEFVEQVGRMILAELSPLHPGYPCAARAVELVAEWRADPGVTGNALLNSLMNESDEGVFAYVDVYNPKPTDHIFNVVGAAVSYASWHAYRVSGEALPEGIDEVSEGVVQWLVDEASRSPVYDEFGVRALLSAAGYDAQPIAAADGFAAR